MLNGIRISTRDLVVQAADYGMTAAGWFDLDKNVDIGGHALLTRQFSNEIIDAKRNVVYVTNGTGRSTSRSESAVNCPSPMCRRTSRRWHKTQPAIC